MNVSVKRALLCLLHQNNPKAPTGIPTPQETDTRVRERDRGFTVTNVLYKNILRQEQSVRFL